MNKNVLALLRFWPVVAIVAMSSLFPGTAWGYPYELYARYSPVAGGDPIKVKIEPGSELVPGDPTNAKFDGIFLQGKSDQLAQMEISRLKGLLVSISLPSKTCPGVECSKSRDLFIKKEQLGSGEPRLILPPTNTYGGSVGEVLINVYGRFEDDFLCEQELSLRAKEGTRGTLKALPAAPGGGAPGGGAPGAPPKAAVLPVTVAPPTSLNFLELSNVAVLRGATETPEDRTKMLTAYTTLFSTALMTDQQRQPIVYSFCNDVSRRIKWEAVATLDAGKVVEDQALIEAAHTRHKELLAAQLVAAMNKQGTAENVHVAKRGTDKFANIYSQLGHRVSLLMDTSDLILEEVGAGQAIRLPSVVDKESQIVLGINTSSHFCAAVAGCHTVIGTKLKVMMSYEDKDKKPVTAISALTSVGNGWLVASDLSAFVGTRLSFTIFYAADGDKHLELMGSNYYAKVENLGLITTAPVVTDIITAAKATKAADVTVRSTIPVSWAINLSKAEYAHAAITFPWMIGVNTRAMPHFADYVKIFPAASVIFPLEDGTGVRVTRLAFGGGIALANAFTFSAAATIQGDPQAFFLIGVSVPDLAKLP